MGRDSRFGFFGVGVIAVATMGIVASTADTCGSGSGTTLSLTREANITEVARETAVARGTVLPTRVPIDTATPDPAAEETEEEVATREPGSPEATQAAQGPLPVPTTELPQQPQVPAPSQPTLSGNYVVTFEVLGNAGNHPADLLSVTLINVLIQRDRSSEPNPVLIDITFNPTLSGRTQIGSTFNEAGGSFTATATAAYRGFLTTWVFDGSVIASQGISGTLTIGGDGKLPGRQAIVYRLSGKRQ